MEIVELNHDELLEVSGGGSIKECVVVGICSLFAPAFIYRIPKVSTGSKYTYLFRAFRTLCFTKKYIMTVGCFMILGFSAPRISGFLRGFISS